MTDTIPILVTPADGSPPFVRELPAGPELDDVPLEELLDLRGGESIRFMPPVKVQSPALPRRRVHIGDLA